MAYTTINEPRDYFETIIWTGNGGAKTIKGLGHKPDLIWSKTRNKTYNHMLSDSSRGFGADKELGSNSTAVEGGLSAESYGYKSGHTADGWTMVNGNTDDADNQEDGNTNEPGVSYVAWTWKANGATTTTNDASSTGIGNIDSTFQADTTSKFSIGIYGGSGTAGHTFKHGLDVKPDLVIIKNISDGVGHSWAVYHSGIGAEYGMQLNGTDAKSDGPIWFNDTEPTTALVSVGASGSATNSAGTNNRLFYAFANVQGFQKHGTYEGNGNANGTFTYLGFKPAFVMIKNADGAGDEWVMLTGDIATGGGHPGGGVVTGGGNSGHAAGNPVTDALYANSSGAETGTFTTDFLSNGFKIKHTSGATNTDGETYLYMAWAEAPFVTSNGAPVNGR